MAGWGDGAGRPRGPAPGGAEGGEGGRGRGGGARPRRGRLFGLPGGEHEQRGEADEDRAREDEDCPRRARVERAVEQGAEAVDHPACPPLAAGGWA